MQHFQALRKELEAAELQECTFHPQLCRRTGRAAATSCKRGAVEPVKLPLHERLAHLEMQRRSARSTFVIAAAAPAADMALKGRPCRRSTYG